MIDANQGDYLLGWDTDEFPSNVYEATMCMYEVIKAGGLTGGFNFDSKNRRPSYTAEDMFYAFILGMDTFALGLIKAAEIIEITENDGAAKYLKMIIEGMGITEYKLTLSKAADSNEYIYTIECDEDGTLIGRRGETLDSIQYLLRLSINKGIDDDKHRKVSVNIGNYREKRNDNLRSLAHRSAKQVLKYGKNVVLDPMNPYERRIVHTAIQEIEGVTSHSIGQDAGRKVIISLEEGVQPTHPSKGGYNKGGRNDRRRGGKGGYQKKEAYQPETTRAPRKDTAGSLYGKIEIPTKNTTEE